MPRKQLTLPWIGSVSAATKPPHASSTSNANYPAGDTATELRNTRFWDRTVKILDAVGQPTRLSGVAEELIAKASREELGVLLAELPSYIQAKAQKFDNPQARESTINGYSAAIEAATAKAVPEYAKAKKQSINAEKAFQVTALNAKHIREQFSVGAPGAYRKPRFIDARKYDPDR
jgi:hypothetical protein